MTRDHAHWTDHDLERFLDQDLSPEARDQLAEALRADGALRARLGAIIDADSAIRAALLDERPAATAAGSAARLRIAGPMKFAAAAAAVALAVGAWSLVSRVAPPARGPIVDARAVEAPETAADGLLAAARGDGLLIALVAEGEGVARSTAPAAAEAPKASALELLDRGDLDAALAMIREQPGDAGAMWRSLGQRLYSGQAAEEVLMSLPPERQVEVCRAWAEQPSLRPVTFEWLARLGASEDASVRSAVSALRVDLGRRPELRAWLRSYASAAGPGPMTP